jgi:hypothetical protein
MELLSSTYVIERDKHVDTTEEMLHTCRVSCNIWQEQQEMHGALGGGTSGLNTNVLCNLPRFSCRMAVLPCLFCSDCHDLAS